MRCLCAVLALMMLAGCSSAPFVEQRALEPDSVPTEPQEPGPSAPTAPGDLKEAPLEAAELRIQRAGVIELDVRDDLKFSLELLKHAGKFDAVVMSFSHTEVSLRMPSARLMPLLEWLSAQDARNVELAGFDFTALDRSGEYFSLEARLEAASAVRDRTLTLLRDAGTAAAVSELESRLEAAQQKLDALQSTLHDIRARAGRVEVCVKLK